MTVKLNQDSKLKIIFSVTLMAVLGVSSVTPAFPLIKNEFSLRSEQVGYLITFFTLPGIFLTPVLGILADRFGRKKILIPSLMIFGIFGFACGFVRNFHLLLIFRFLQGFGAASLGSLNITLIGDIYQGQDRVKAMGWNASVLSIGTASYPAVGGLLASLGWQFPFFLPVVAIPIAIWAIFKLNNPEPSPIISWKTYFKNVFKYAANRNVIILFFSSFMTFIILYGVYLTFFPLYLNQKFSFQPATIGFTMSLASITTAITSSRLAFFHKYVHQKSIVILAFTFYAISMIVLAIARSYAFVLIGVILFGMGHGTNFPVIQVMLTRAVPFEFRAAFMSMNGTILRLGQSSGPVIMGLLFPLIAIHGIFISGAIIAIITGLTIWFGVAKNFGHDSHKSNTK